MMIPLFLGTESSPEFDSSTVFFLYNSSFPPKQDFRCLLSISICQTTIYYLLIKKL